MSPTPVISDTSTASILTLRNNAEDTPALTLSAAWIGVQVDSAGRQGVRVVSAEREGVRVNSAGFDGVLVDSADDDGLQVNSAGDDGAYVGSAGRAGVRVFSAGEDGVYVDSADDDGFEVDSAGDDGAYVGSTGRDGVRVFRAGEDGVHVYSADEDGLEVESAGGFGVFVGSAGGNGLYVVSAGDDGIQVLSAADYAGNFSGDVRVSGNLSKGGGGFQIDHPLDPEHRYLAHSFVESPDMMNVYNGNVTTDEEGYAAVTLPDYFEALNEDFRYQLTVIGTFAQAIVAQEIADGQFLIQTDEPNVKVSWQVTGIRKDPWAEANRIVVEEEKPADERGVYVHPEAYGLPKTMGLAHREAQEHEAERSAAGR